MENTKSVENNEENRYYKTEKEGRAALKEYKEWGYSLYQLPKSALQQLQKPKLTKTLKEIKEQYKSKFLEVQALRPKRDKYGEIRWNGGLNLVNIRNISLNNPVISQNGYKFNDLFRLLYCRDLYLAAYERLRSNKGAATKGLENRYIEDIASSDAISELIQEIRKGKYKPTPVRRVYISKPGKNDLRPLGVPSIKDQLVQEIVRLILSAVFEPTFMACSHGFRNNRSTHTALQYTTNEMRGCMYMLEGDMSKCFDEKNHKLLMKILKHRISDIRFLNIIKAFLQAGYLAPGLSTEKRTNKLKEKFIFPEGTPQGSLISPMLTNIFLHQLDKFVVDYCNKRMCQHNSSRSSKSLHTLPYNRLTTRINRIRVKLQGNTIADKTKMKELIREERKLHLDRLKLQTSVTNESKRITMRYVRYANNWILGVKGPRKLAVQAQADIKAFLKNSLNLRLSDTKTKITNLYDEAVIFLGFEISRPKQWIIRRARSVHKLEKFGQKKPRYYTKLCKVGRAHV
eukprot:TRINITY_DN19503_c1_g3_i1.p1 TRINITY_DN19503_c1_g3~~TRINITY_DN19503_c1_g3_i1.p1  ORF type:complete len:514 (+),score=12.18 TRINITY_DN19503_c1_g3_i1:662-2203(+)